MSDVRYQCPCCGYYTLTMRADHVPVEWCPVCWWEDDCGEETFGVDAPERPQGPNHVQLWQARENFADFGACAKHIKQFVRSPLLEELPENNRHQPLYRYARQLPCDFKLDSPLAPPRLSEDELMAIMRQSIGRPWPTTSYTIAYGSLIYPRLQRMDDGVIFEPNGVRDYWRLVRRGGWALVDDKDEHLVLALDGEQWLIARNVKMLRTEAKLSERGLAKRAGISHITISAIEQDHTMPQRATIEKLAAAFDISSDELCTPRFV